ncbi:MAG TPA: sulfite exporter TauE/SafE family protein, partial [Humisphaera sp.]|nr:sulfite exporter TauE/SafE family protein [Humisphaera sp.]
MSPWWLVAGTAFILIGITKSGFGSGVGLMVVPMTIMAAPHLPSTGGVQHVLGLVLPLLIAGDIIAVGQYRRLFSPQVVKRLLPGTVIGILIGGVLLWSMGKQRSELLASFIKIEVGLESVILVGLHWYRTWRAGHEVKFHPSSIRSGAVGAFAGASSTLAHAAGPIIALHLLPQRMERQIFVGTCAVYFFLVNTAKLPIYRLSGQFHADTLLLSMKLLPLVFVGAGFGYWVTKRMNDRYFSRIVYA